MKKIIAGITLFLILTGALAYSRENPALSHSTNNNQIYIALLDNDSENSNF